MAVIVVEADIEDSLVEGRRDSGDDVRLAVADMGLIGTRVRRAGAREGPRQSTPSTCTSSWAAIPAVLPRRPVSGEQPIPPR